jgi:hypothetical protein
MGLLDEAIREHLELQRKRGADPAEVTRQEQEALGPAVREQPQPPQAAVPDPDHPQGLTGAEDAATSALAPEAPDSEAGLEPIEDLPPAVPDPEAPPHQGPEPGEGLRPDPEAPAPPAPEAQETVAFDADEIFAEDKPPEAEEEDVLEETPDFLQETPEHDRLWFEQKPPRDFDFDD